jgi:RNA polymerase sigma-70 factor (ECF subfamily)
VHREPEDVAESCKIHDIARTVTRRMSPIESGSAFANRTLIEIGQAESADVIGPGSSVPSGVKKSSSAEKLWRSSHDHDIMQPPFSFCLDQFPSRAVFMDLAVTGSGLHVERFREYLCLLAREHLAPGNPSKLEASDIVQQTLLEACQQQAQFRGQSDGELAGWLKQMLIHNLADALRESRRAKRDVRRERSLEAAIDDSFSRTENWLAANDLTPSHEAMRVEGMLRLADALADLPDKQREAVVLHHIQGRSLAVLAQQLNRSESAVAGLLHRGLKALRRLLDETDTPKINRESTPG